MEKTKSQEMAEDAWTEGFLMGFPPQRHMSQRDQAGFTVCLGSDDSADSLDPDRSRKAGLRVGEECGRTLLRTLRLGWQVTGVKVQCACLLPRIVPVDGHEHWKLYGYIHVAVQWPELPAEERAVTQEEA